MKPYFQDEYVTIYHADCRQVIPQAIGDVLITDPVWPNANAGLIGQEDPYNLFNQMLKYLSPVKRMAIQLGCDSDVRILNEIKLDFFRVQWLRFAVPGHKGRKLHSGDVAYLFGQPPSCIPGRRLI